MSSFCTVFLLSAPYSVLTYEVSPFFPSVTWKAGIRVVVPLGGGVRLGIVQHTQAMLPEGVRAREMVWPVDVEALLTVNYLDFIMDLSIRQMDPPGRILARVLPAEFCTIPDFQDTQGRRYAIADLRALAPEAKRTLAGFWVEGALRPVGVKRRTEQLFSLTAAPPWPLRPGATMQLDVLRYLDVHGVSSSTRMAAHFGRSVSKTLQTLARKQLVCEVDSVLHPPGPSEENGERVALNAEQFAVVGQCARLLQEERPHVALVHGVTGSGKTAVYLEVLEQCLREGGHAMLLAPEVAIALKLYADVRLALPKARVFCHHGYLSAAKRYQSFVDIAHSQEPTIVVGTRSCLFLPIEPRLVVLDEEHDASFKQGEGVVYQARELAYSRIVQSKGLLLMGSATPDVKVYHAAKSGGIALLRLPYRVGSSRLPEVELVDLRADPPARGPFSLAVGRAIIETVQRNEQVIILHNRRGYAPVLYCEMCKEPVRCPNCHVSMTFHKRRSCLLCHYCGFSYAYPCPCPSCHSGHFVPLGEGTERLEEFLRQELPEEVRVARLDRDSTRQAAAMQETLAAFSRHEIQVLVGTQMLSKGHHFPDVTLAVVVDGDLGLNLPDYRATERCFQLLVQVAGRAGRGGRSGRVLIQTRNPEHYCWNFIRRNDYEGFFEREIALRQSMRYPPFVKLALIRLSWPTAHSAAMFLESFTRHARAAAAAAGVQILGPAQAPLAVLRGRERYQCLLKADEWVSIRQVYARVKKIGIRERHIRMTLDLDPVDML